jgi:hypothetical protein
MTPSARGLLVAAGTATVVLVVGVVFVFGGGQPTPPATPAAAKQPDESDLSLEARRQARLAKSQAMLGGGPSAAPETEFAAEPAGSPAPPSAPIAEPAPVAPIGPTPSAAEPVPPASTPKAAVVVPLPAPGPRCIVATSGTSPVAEACRQGGIPEAKRTMKRLVAEAKAHGARFNCKRCHLDLDAYTLRDNARSEFTSLLAASATK